ncbi:hypothetical protein L596_019870 [Steinernema carpocapsae]|uniref:Uncharacterized protein n=1 Tax=Steinernema carpocapsae TaxID=34508 RepID=A0A4U5MSP6_STECR|nr:hypothetical protein L596_019870 [Steinernema carpocapsae]
MADYETALDYCEMKMVIVNHPPVQNRSTGPMEQRVPVQSIISVAKDNREQPPRKVEQSVEGRRSPNTEKSSFRNFPTGEEKE